VAALLAGDVDGIPRGVSAQNVKQFQSDARFSVTIGGTEGKTIVSITTRRSPSTTCACARALAAAIDRKAVIDGSSEGYGKAIGSHLVPSDAGYIDLTGANPYNPEKAKALLKEAGVTLPLNVTLALPPPGYARQGGEIVAAQLAKVRHQREDRERRVGAMARRPVQGQLRPDHHQPRRAAGLRPLRRPEVLLGLRQQGLQQAARRLQQQRRREDPHQADRRHPAPARDRRRQRLPVPAAAVRDRQEAAQGHVDSSPIFANDLAALAWQ